MLLADMAGVCLKRIGFALILLFIFIIYKKFFAFFWTFLIFVVKN